MSVAGKKLFEIVFSMQNIQKIDEKWKVVVSAGIEPTSKV